MRRTVAAWLVLATGLAAGPAHADPRAGLRSSGCAAIAASVDAAAPAGPVFIASYPTETNGLPALRQTAFVYDNALAVIALLACGDRGRAARIGAAIRLAAAADRFFHDGRVRNAYRAGPVRTPAALPGWWNRQEGRWDEDAYQVGSATGNVAWAALALLWLDTPADTKAAAGLLRWVMATTATGPGFAGGFFGEEPHQARLGWLSTEHNVDVAAAAGVLARRTGEAGFAAAAATARGFVGSMWDGTDGKFWLGDGTDGHTLNRNGTALDAELWPLIGIDQAPLEWRRAVAWVDGHHAVAGGFGFRVAPDGLWTEGTAQAALVLDRPALFAVLARQSGPGGYLFATAATRVRTGLALTPDSTTDDFYYFHLPHLGATAWSVLAATATNPFAPPGR